MPFRGTAHTGLSDLNELKGRCVVFLLPAPNTGQMLGRDKNGAVSEFR
jgi:hypothetical protein